VTKVQSWRSKDESLKCCQNIPDKYNPQLNRSNATSQPFNATMISKQKNNVAKFPKWTTVLYLLQGE
jgi:hypothetical protein